jgi:hypothetical protein
MEFSNRDIKDANIALLGKTFCLIREFDGYLSSDRINDIMTLDKYKKYRRFVKFVASTPVGLWDTHNVHDMTSVFESMVCNFSDAQYRTINDDYSLGPLIDVKPKDKFLDKWNTGFVSTMRKMFKNCKFLTQIFYSDNTYWDTSRVTEMDEMFSGCLSYPGDSSISNWDVGNLMIADEMFLNCREFNIDISNWDIGYLRQARNMFRGCVKFVQDLSKWDIPTDFLESIPVRFRESENLMNVMGFGRKMTKDKWPQIEKPVLTGTIMKGSRSSRGSRKGSRSRSSSRGSRKGSRSRSSSRGSRKVSRSRGGGKRTRKC